jgi:hypothetical protein
MNQKVIRISLILTLLLIIGCGTVTTIRPIRKGESAFAFSLGGPVTNVSGMNIPIPYTVIRYRYGLRDNLNLYAGSHLLLFALGDIGLDAGISYYFLKQAKWIPAVGIGAGIYGFSKPGKDIRAFPEFEFTGSYIFGNRFLTYFGTQSMFQFNAKPNLVLSPFIGEEVRISKKFSVTLETKWYAPSEVTKPRAIDYKIPISNHGALGFVFGLNYLLGGWYD